MSNFINQSFLNKQDARFDQKMLKRRKEFEQFRTDFYLSILEDLVKNLNEACSNVYLNKEDKTITQEERKSFNVIYNKYLEMKNRIKDNPNFFTEFNPVLKKQIRLIEQKLILMADLLGKDKNELEIDCDKDALEEIENRKKTKTESLSSKSTHPRIQELIDDIDSDIKHIQKLHEEIKKIKQEDPKSALIKLYQFFIEFNQRFIARSQLRMREISIEEAIKNNDIKTVADFENYEAELEQQKPRHDPGIPKT